MEPTTTRNRLLAAEFYPTPPEVAAEMLDPIDLIGKAVLEPSAGRGDLIRACLQRGAAEVFWCEPETDLRAVLGTIQLATPLFLGGQGYGGDFLKVPADRCSHVDVIAMNPPFSNAAQHILHAWEIAPPGCQIVALCNWSTISDRWGSARGQLGALVDAYGSAVKLGPVFSEADRATDVIVGLVRLQKPGGGAGDEFEGFFMGPDELEAQGHGLIPYRRSRDIVNRYVEACRIFDEQVNAGVRLKGVLDGLFGKELGLQVTMEGAAVTRNRFRRELQKDAWKHVFDEFLPRMMATTQLSHDINAFVERQSEIPFTERNIYRMLQIVAGTQEQRISRAVEEAIDNLTRHTKENRWNVEGWATNSCYMLNQKIIFPYLAEENWSKTGVKILTYGDAYNRLQDLLKALCWLAGCSLEEGWVHPCAKDELLPPGQWRDAGRFFEVKAFKKGTVHMKFKSRDAWAAINRRYAEAKGLTLPERI
jgi:hypothetical protein